MKKRQNNKKKTEWHKDKITKKQYKAKGSGNRKQAMNWDG